MRLHRLRLCAIGPFAGEQTIDFEPLGAGGLFLLDGPTGSGKSTVLDAITFALYGPGEGGGWGRLHSHFAAPDTMPEVQLEFSVRGVRQRVTRSPEYLRPKRRGDGAVLERAHVHLERRDGELWVSRSSRKDEVGEMLGDDLGLTREQFRQVVLLPQGEFMQFLRANDDERRALLTKLFGTELYDRITDELDRRRLVATRDLDAAKNRLRLRIGAAAEAAGLGSDEQDELAGLDAQAREHRLDALERQLANAASSALATAERAAAALVERHALAERAELLAERMLRFVAAWRARARHELTRCAHEQAAAALAAAERAEPVRPLVEACVDAESTVEAALAALLQLAPDAHAAWKRGEGGVKLVADSATASRRAAELTPLVAREKTTPGQQAALDAARVRLAAATDTVWCLAVRQGQLPAEVDAAERQIRASRAQAAALDGLQHRRASAAARLAAFRALAELEPERTAMRQRRENAFDGYAKAVTRHLQLVEARLANMAAELATSLADGEPCVVCGGRDHPAPAQPSPGAASADEVAAADIVRADAERERDLAARQLATIDERRVGLLAKIGMAGPEAATVSRDDEARLAAELAELDAAIGAARRSAAGLDQLDQTKNVLKTEAAALAAAQQKAAADEAAAAAQVATAEQLTGELAADVRAAAQGYLSVAVRQQALQAEAARLARIGDAVATVARATVASDAALARAAREAKSTGFADLDSARAAVLPRGRLVELRCVASEWESIASRVHGALDVAEFAGLDIGDEREVASAVRTARQVLNDTEMSARQLAITADRARTGAERFAAARREVDVALRDHDDVDHAGAPVVHLAKLAKGVAGQRRVALTTYVLRQWFEQVVAAANVRLSGMSSGRYELVRVDEGNSRTERVGLTLQVLDRHTGEQRNARSLSGGETFYTSLALALGLADVVRAEAGGVDLDTLFIDEGFGSLDAGTLDQVMGVIDELRDRGRTVGIVSHVSELKDRIAERIEVRRLADGSSTLRVVA